MTEDICTVAFDGPDGGSVEVKLTRPQAVELVNALLPFIREGDRD